MSNPVHQFELPPEQQAIRDKCFHPTGMFVEFREEDLEQSVPERFDRIVQQYPDRIAVKMGDYGLTYNELSKLANHVAYSIIEKRGTISEPVLLIAEHGPCSIIACLGILKAGKILVAVDSSFPMQRIAFMVDDSQAEVILTDSKSYSLAKNLTQGGRRVINIETLGENLCDDEPKVHVTPEAIAEIRYSSGSTGRPKGIIRSHRRILYSAMQRINIAHICPDDRLVISRNLSVGGKDTFRGLLSGAAVFPFDIKQSGFAKLADLVVQERITHYASVPSTFRYFIRALDAAAKLPSVRLIELGGESLSKRDVDSYKHHFSQDCILLHKYSSAETGNLCYYFVDQQTTIPTPVVPVGYPVEGKEVFITDEKGNDVGVDCIGEIAVRSRYLSTGYWRDSELTNSKFFADSEERDRRVYLTGDLGRTMVDGCLIYLGRKDLEIKIRGYRVAPTEIEAVLLDHPLVKDIGVAAWNHNSEDKDLVAYVVPFEHSAPTSADLREFLRGRLPDYMIPSAIVFLNSLPSTNGKLDRTALPKPDAIRSELSTSYAPPQTEIEERLTRIWSEVLGIDSVGIHDNFFDLGGHSLDATQIMSRVIQTFQLELPIKALFDSPTVADMAVVITQNRVKKASQEDLARLLSEVEALSDEEAQKLLAVESARSSREDGHE
jgi:amino acid adenylation domain-containing protein